METKLFKNKNFTKRDYECTNVVFCMAAVAPSSDWIQTDEQMPESMGLLERRGDAAYYGWL